MREVSRRNEKSKVTVWWILYADYLFSGPKDWKSSLLIGPISVYIIKSIL